MQTTQFKIRLPNGKFLLDRHGKEAVYTMGGAPDARIGLLERKVGGRAVDSLTRPLVSPGSTPGPWHLD